ncbi:MAG: D-alanyl-D-alanine carboxypeptidase [Lachnospiraceae bacterium]|nr:D-alanyl-D-alanine carboxypeptidase [Lachnospiraceae bacterium]
MNGFRDLDPAQAEQVVGTSSRRRKIEYLEEQLYAPLMREYDASPSEEAPRRRAWRTASDRSPETGPVSPRTASEDAAADRVPQDRRPEVRMAPGRSAAGRAPQQDVRSAPRRSNPYDDDDYYEDAQSYADDEPEETPAYDDRPRMRQIHPGDDGEQEDYYEPEEYYEPRQEQRERSRRGRRPDPSGDRYVDNSYYERRPSRRPERYEEPEEEEDDGYEYYEDGRLIRRRNRRRNPYLAAYLRRAAVISVICIGIIVGIFVISGKLRARNAEKQAEAAQREAEEQMAAQIAESWNGRLGGDGTDGEEITEHEDTTYLTPSEEQDVFFSGYEIHESGTTAEIVDEEVQSTYAVLVNAETGEVVAGKGADEVTSPASMTKILTLLVAVEHLTDLDETVVMTQEVGDFIYRKDLSAVGFQVGDVIPVRDLLYGTILPSGADAAMLLAQHVAGSEEAFVGMMNDKIAELGLSETAHFSNPVGLYDSENHCTMKDMAMILKAAVENELCREVLSAHTYTTTGTQDHPEGIEISNWFLRRIEDKDAHGEVICAKTGFVDQSGCCAASYQISNDGGHYICVTGNAWSSWRCIYDHVRIYDLYTK